MAYFSNGTEGAILERQCKECQIDDDICPILAMQLEYNYAQCKNELAIKIMNTLVDEDGICQMFELVNKEAK